MEFYCRLLHFNSILIMSSSYNQSSISNDHTNSDMKNKRSTSTLTSNLATDPPQPMYQAYGTDPTSIHFRRQSDEQDEEELTNTIERLIHEFLLRPSRRHPYRSFFRWTINDDTISRYNVILQIEQEPSSNALF